MVVRFQPFLLWLLAPPGLHTVARRAYRLNDRRGADVIPFACLHQQVMATHSVRPLYGELWASNIHKTSYMVWGP